MGIRYYAYAFDADRTEEALEDPMSVIGDDPLADAWGMEPGFSVGFMGERPRLPERDLLYLDKAWSQLQWAVTTLEAGRRRSGGNSGPGGAGGGTAHRMFEGDVTMTDRGWVPWSRTITPEEARGVGKDLLLIGDADIEDVMRSRPRGAQSRREIDYVLHFMGEARAFVAGVVEEGRGFAYMIG